MSYPDIAAGVYFLVWTVLATITEVSHKKDSVDHPNDPKDYYLGLLTKNDRLHIMSMFWPMFAFGIVFCIPLWIAKFIGEKTRSKK